MQYKPTLEWLVVHSTETEFGLDVSISDINSEHIEKFGIIGFSDIIDFEGNIEGTYKLYDYRKDKPYDWGLENSRHVAYIGGLSEDGFYKADTMSPEQKETLDVYIMYMKRRHPKLKVIKSKDLYSCKKELKETI
jgi:hypothetical protein